MQLIQRGVTGSTLSGDELLKLLDNTVDVARLLGTEELSTFLAGSKEDKLYQYLRSALISDNAESGISGHNLRKTTQAILKSDFNGDVTAFATFLMERGSHVANHSIDTCSESFLTQLYDIYETANDVVHAKASLLEWHGEITKDDSLIDRAKSLRLDIKLARVRGDIDDNRIYVDPIRFNQWLSDNISAHIRSAIPIVTEWVQAFNHGVDLEYPITLLQRPELTVASILDRAFNEFCSNKYYGVDSYIGRRIRHGTLRGVMVSEVKTIVESFSTEHRDAGRPVAYLQNWLARYESTVDTIGNELLHLRTDAKKRGGIVPSVTPSNKSNALITSIDGISKQLTAENPIPIESRPLLGMIRQSTASCRLRRWDQMGERLALAGTPGSPRSTSPANNTAGRDAFRQPKAGVIRKDHSLETVSCMLQCIKHNTAMQYWRC
jgi:hypothetical protein